jgi:hypothetical protein
MGLLDVDRIAAEIMTRSTPQAVYHYLENAPSHCLPTATEGHMAVATAIMRDTWKHLADQLAASLARAKRITEERAPQVKEKGINTARETPSLDLTLAQNEPSPPRPEDVSAREYDPSPTARSRATPRQRLRQPSRQPRDCREQLDRLLQSYLAKSSVMVPANFSRVEGTENMFHFGSKKIELLPSETFVTVKVGGGYLLFDEFCARYLRLGQYRLYSTHSGTVAGASLGTTVTHADPSLRTPSPNRPSVGGGFSSKRSASPQSGPPRVLIRTGKGLVLS